MIGMIAGLVLIVNVGPMIWLGICIWLLYLVFKKFIRSESTGAKIGWVLLGIFLLSITLPSSYAVVGLGAAAVLYLVFTNWNKQDKDDEPMDEHDPFTNFEREWEEINNY